MYSIGPLTDVNFRADLPEILCFESSPTEVPRSYSYASYRWVDGAPRVEMIRARSMLRYTLMQEAPSFERETRLEWPGCDE